MKSFEIESEVFSGLLPDWSWLQQVCPGTAATAKEFPMLAKEKILAPTRIRTQQHPLAADFHSDFGPSRTFPSNKHPSDSRSIDRKNSRLRSARNGGSFTLSPPLTTLLVHLQIFLCHRHPHLPRPPYDDWRDNEEADEDCESFIHVVRRLVRRAMWGD